MRALLESERCQMGGWMGWHMHAGCSARRGEQA